MNERGGWFLPETDSYFGAFVPAQSVSGYKENGFQKDHLLAAFKYVTDWRTAIDVGAHVGFWAWDMADRFEKVICFEPADDTFECLSKNLEGKANVELHQVAISDHAGVCRVRNDPHRWSAIKGYNSGARFVHPDRGETPMRTLDSFGFSNCGLLKIDVEGYELMVLKGAERLIEKHRPIIIMETDKRFASRYDLNHGAAQAHIQAMGYRQVWAKRPDRIFRHG